MPCPVPQISLGRFMGLVSILGLGLAALRHAVDHWGADDVTALALTVLLGTNVVAWFSGARRQVFWAGFGLTGWAYLMLSWGPPAGPYLPTTDFLDGLHARLYPTKPDLFPGEAFDQVVSGPAHAERFIRAGHSVVSLALALIGGVGAVVLFPDRNGGKGEPFPPDGSLLGARWRDRPPAAGEDRERPGDDQTNPIRAGHVP